MNDEAPPTPVWLFTGFLGSGKTTLLARLMRRPELADTAVIVNEFGEVGLDHHLVARGEESAVVLLDSGCLCCAIGDNLGETLSDLFHRRARGEIPAFARVVIETTGLADPGPILRTLLADRIIMRRYAVAGVVTVVDGVLGAAQIARYPEAQRQVALADRLVVSKRDLIDAISLDTIEHALRGRNGRAEILAASQGEIDPSTLLAPLNMAHAMTPPAEHHAAHVYDGDIGTIFLPIPTSITWTQYAALVRYFQDNIGVRLLRTKGLVRIAGESGLQVVQGVQHLFAPLVELPRDVETRTGFVLIGEALDHARLVEDLEPYGVVA